MRDIQEKISPLIKSLFPSFYLDEGQEFVAFIEAYYEWLEENHQLLDVVSNTGIEVGDTVTQANTTGSVISVQGNNVLVSVNNFDAFRCNVLCDELIPITTSSGGNTFVLTQLKINPLYYARKLFDIRDVDKTLDEFIVHFKEKYLKNIEFDTNTNKRLLVKNSFDLYRSKGTERSIDLFFKLVFGAQATVYYPGDDIMRLSSAEFYTPKYIEITPSPRNVGLVGKQITGSSSGATAFVEKFVKRRVKDGFVYVLEISNPAGEFVNGELLRNTTVFSDLPKVVGSLNGLTVISGSSLFAVGDIVTFVSQRGAEGRGRISAISNKTGIVDFELFDGGWGYTVSSPSGDLSQDELSQRTQSIISQKVLTLANVVTSNSIAGFVISGGGTGYSNADTITVQSAYTNCSATINTNGSGVITNIHISNHGAGFFTSSPTVTITTSTGTSANIQATTKAFDTYFKYFEKATQRLANVVYTNAPHANVFAEGQSIHIGNSSTNVAFGTIIGNAVGTTTNGISNGQLTISISNNGSFGTSNTIFLSSNVSVTANVNAITNTSATATVMGLPYTANLNLTAITGTFPIAAEVFQLNAENVEVANGIIVDTFISQGSGIIEIGDLHGVFKQSNTLPLKIRSSATIATITDVTLTVGLYEIANTFIQGSAHPPIFTTNTATIANVISISAGSGASFKVSAITESETVFLNTDLLNGNGTFTNNANQSFMTIPINNLEYGFEKAPAGNNDSIIFDCLTFDSFTIGTIATLSEINPGADYTVDPYVLVRQPGLSNFNRSDYIIEFNNAVGTFVVGERILQTNTTLSKTTLVLSNEAGLAVGEKVIQGTANGIIDSVQSTANTIIVKDVSGTFQANATSLTSASNGSFSATVSSVSTNSAITSTAKGIVKSSNTTHLEVKRIQFENLFQPSLSITGQVSGATATINAIAEDQSVLPIGFNANVYANVVTANGSVTAIQVVDSGRGYSNNEQITYVSADGLRSGAAVANVFGFGTGTGFYKDSKDRLSSTSKIHDGDFYQEYSYEILSRIPLERYSEMFKKVMHTAGTRFFGGVVLDNELNTNVDYADSQQVTFDPVEQQSFNANTNVASDIITLTAHLFANGMKVNYFTAAGNTALAELGNNNIYYVANTTTNSIKLTTNPRIYTYSFNSNTDVNSTNNFITLIRHNLQDNDIVKYTTSAGNTALAGLSNNQQLHIVSSNNSGVKVSTTRGGAAANITNSTTQNGHFLTLTTINITDGLTESGHFIAQLNET